MRPGPKSGKASKGLKSKLPATWHAGKHDNATIEIDGEVFGTVTVPNHGSKELVPMTWKSICDQLGLTDEQARLFVRCKLSRGDYVDIIRNLP